MSLEEIGNIYSNFKFSPSNKLCIGGDIVRYSEKILIKSFIEEKYILNISDDIESLI